MFLNNILDFAFGSGDQKQKKGCPHIFELHFELSIHVCPCVSGLGVLNKVTFAFKFLTPVFLIWVLNELENIAVVITNSRTTGKDKKGQTFLK